MQLNDEIDRRAGLARDSASRNISCRSGRSSSPALSRVASAVVSVGATTRLFEWN